MIEAAVEKAASIISQASALLIGAGAGMGVDSGLPDFRGPQGFWSAYPPYQERGLDFVSLANPRWFAEDPELAWGFYGHRMGLYRRTNPHEGFDILRRWAGRMPLGGFVFTSNVDGHFQRAGFAAERIVEVHGSFEGMQCTGDCGMGVFPGDAIEVAIDLTTMKAIRPLPVCPNCGAVARPNILMFGDWGWDSARADTQHRNMAEWLDSLSGVRLAVVECGAGQAIPTVRSTCERVARLCEGTLIRINPREADVPRGQISLPMGALAGLRLLDERIEGVGGIASNTR
ncbi:MAG: SIR2 family NAD-dependent protein deacylase [Isosphaeraceae bacterium]